MEVTNEMNRSQLKRSIHNLTGDLENMSYLRDNNCQLQREIQLLKMNEQNCNKLLKENDALKKELRTRRDVFGILKENKNDFLKREEQLKKTLKEKDTLNKQLKLESGPLKKTIKNLEAALSKQEKDQKMKIHSLELEVDKSQKKVSKLWEKNDSLQGTNTTLQDDKKKLQKQVNQLQHDLNNLQLENKSLDKKLNETSARELHQKKIARTLEIKCCDVRKQLEMSKYKHGVKNPFDFLNDQEPSRNEKTLAERELQSTLNSKSKELVKTVLLVEERDTQIEQLKKEMARLVPPKNLELIPKYKQMIRERGETIKALTAEVKMYQSKHEESKSERDTLVDRVVALKKSYLKEKVQHSELFALTQVNSILLPESSNVLQKQSREHQLDSRRTTLKPTSVRFPPISN